MSLDRPQYGEYASPEEQRARAGLPPVEQPSASAPLHPAQVQAAGMPAPVVAGTPTAAATGVTSAGRIATFALLGFGLFNVLTSVPGFLNLATTMNQTMDLLGLKGEFSNFAAARTWGAIAAIMLIAGYAVTAWLAIGRLRRNRSAWWIPVVGAVVSFGLVMVCISVPMFGDSAFTQGMLTPPAG